MLSAGCFVLQKGDNLLAMPAIVIFVHVNENGEEYASIRYIDQPYVLTAKADDLKVINARTFIKYWCLNLIEFEL